MHMDRTKEEVGTRSGPMVHYGENLRPGRYRLFVTSYAASNWHKTCKGARGSGLEPPMRLKKESGWIRLQAK